MCIKDLLNAKHFPRFLTYVSLLFTESFIF